jgi:hypothetical protein
MAPPPFRYTSYDLDSSIEVARVLWQRGGGIASAEELAVFLGYSKAKNGAFLTRLANARLFGLVEGSSSELRPTTRALIILKPDYPAAADQARLEAFEDVPLFKVVLDHYHGQALPDDIGLKNALETRWGITADKSAMVLSRLMESAEQAGLFRTTGNRDKMVRPTIARGESLQKSGPGDTPATLPDGMAREQDEETGQRHELHTAPRGIRANKLIDGALDELPPAGQWEEAQLEQWLAFFESALRVVYRLPAESRTAPVRVVTSAREEMA